MSFKEKEIFHPENSGYRIAKVLLIPPTWHHRIADRIPACIYLHVDSYGRISLETAEELRDALDKAIQAGKKMKLEKPSR